jgi:cell division control protein 45
MNMDLKRDLREKMDQIAPEYGLVELVYPSFVRSFGYRSQPLCAADVVDGVSALLEVATGVRLEVEVEGGRGGGEWFGGGKVWNLGKWDKENKENIPAVLAAGGQKKTKPDENGNDDEGESENQEERWWERNFWVAFDALGNE